MPMGHRLPSRSQPQCDLCLGGHGVGKSHRSADVVCGGNKGEKDESEIDATGRKNDDGVGEGAEGCHVGQDA